MLVEHFPLTSLNNPGFFLLSLIAAQRSGIGNPNTLRKKQGLSLKQLYLLFFSFKIESWRRQTYQLNFTGLAATEEGD